MAQWLGNTAVKYLIAFSEGLKLISSAMRNTAPIQYNKLQCYSALAYILSQNRPFLVNIHHQCALFITVTDFQGADLFSNTMHCCTLFLTSVSIHHVLFFKTQIQQKKCGLPYNKSMGSNIRLFEKNNTSSVTRNQINIAPPPASTTL